MDCLFCAIVAGDIPAAKVYEDEKTLAFLDISPWHPGHTLVVPKRHVADALSDGDIWAEIGPAITAVGSLLVDRLGAEGINVLSNAGAVAGQEVFHLHIHLIPRYLDNPGMAGLLNKDCRFSLDEITAKLLDNDATARPIGAVE